MHGDHSSPVGVMLFSMWAGLASWLADPNVWRAVAVAALCGFVGGVFKAVGFWAYDSAKRRRRKPRKSS